MTSMSRNTILLVMASTIEPTWSFFTNHARVLLCLARDPAIRQRDIGQRLGITERAAHRIVDELVEAGYVSSERFGRRNRYTVHRHLPLPDRIAPQQKLGELLAILASDDGAR
jgi:DNA-binding MarR family transcriptional regulator